jgi:hypothetical protein
MSGSQFIHQSAALRGQGNFDAAIAVIEANISNFSQEELLVALLQAFYAANEGGHTERAQGFAIQIQALDPNIPTIAQFLRG